MAYTIFSLTGRANPNILAEKLYRQQFKRNIFGNWVAPNFVKVTRDTADVVVPAGEGARFTGSPIEVFKRFLTEGKTTLDIPVRNRLTGMPVFGDKALRGTEEAGQIVYRTVKINLTRKAYSKPTLMSAQITLPYLENLMLESSEYLTDWWNDYHPGNFIVAFAGGASIDMLNAATIGGRAVNVMSHPNMYIVGGSKVTYANGRPGTTGATSYEDEAMDAVDGCNNSTTNALTVKKIKGLVLEAQRLKIAPLMMKAGFKRFAIFISDAQYAQLTEDSDFKTWYQQLPNQLANHPLATGAVADIAGAVVYVDQNMPHAVTPTNKDAALQAPPANTVWYWKQPTAAEYSAGYVVGNMITGRCDQARKVGFLIGQGALSIGVGVPVSGGKKFPSMGFVEEFEDYGAISGVGVQTVQSVFRTDIFDQDGVVSGLSAGDFYENTSSLLFVTNSPDTVT